MTKRNFLVAAMVLVIGLLTPALAQAKDSEQKAQLAQVLTSDGFPLEAQVLNRFVELDMSPEWWAIMLDPAEARGAREGLRIILSNMTSMADRMGLGDVNRLNQDTGRTGSSPPVIGMLDSWKGMINVKIVLQFAPDATSKKETSNGLNSMGNPIGSEAVPRSGKFNLLLTFDPKLTEMKTSMTPDGTNYTVTVPAYTYWRQGNIDDLFKRGQ